jgi:hypothetical protein
MTQNDWKLGDRVMHTGRPEWGAGEVRAAETITQDGKRCQRLTIRFERAGIKTLTTAFAALRAATGPVPMPMPLPEQPDSPATASDHAATVRKLGELPEPASDPFRTKRARLEATLGLYRFTGTGASLLDWAASQTGLKDPLSSFSRQELEQSFERFRFNLEGHLRKLVYELKKEDPSGLAAAVAAAIPAAKQALKRADAAR